MSVGTANALPIGRRRLIASALPLVAMPQPAWASRKPRGELWTFDNLQTVGGQTITLVGAPQRTSSPWGPAIAFDGVGDGLLVDRHPLAGAQTFTFEAIFRPDGGAFEQRWFHLESSEPPPVAPGSGKRRMMFEIRVIEQRWYLDAFVSGADAHQALMVPERTFPTGRWYHVAQSYDGRMHRSFVDGQLQAMASLPFTPQGPGAAAIGMRINRVNYFKGAIRAARFTPRALPPSEFFSAS